MARKGPLIFATGLRLQGWFNTIQSHRYRGDLRCPARPAPLRRVLTLAMKRLSLQLFLGIALLLMAGLLALKEQDKERVSAVSKQVQSNITGPSLPKPSPGLMPFDPSSSKQVLDQLASADLQWIPKSEVMPNGTTRYSYKRRAGEPTLSIAQIRNLMMNPPTFDPERRSISELWQVLEAKGVKIRLVIPLKVGAAGEWDAKQKTIRINPEVLDKGSKEFAWVLNHEAIHVAQSCKRGSLSSNPEVIGLSNNLPPSLESILDKPPYRNAPSQAKGLEQEAFANQANLGLGPSLVKAYCL